ncbi:GIN domain-containing protein [Mucilaginibacter ginsenosidivorax]|uniref:Putative auto-transporter adhesin head GIN domain-containing protein n=1 Tax=Mucilaginibacter ginsenosidivorax TaxID=862126 RepID=A0A5B8W734_9SPHI|nr:DUF2807 domain-containing protein [Mucilaginibacter ginsenosidivorax]QEC78702.1 hypothetical protein FSB76_23145 [Mucilaginibacter ginsenosidivorax]
MATFKKLREMIQIKGNGNIVSKEIHVSSFIRLHLSGKGLFELIQSNEEKVIVETDENLVDFFEIVNSGRTLYISADGKFRKPVYTQCIVRVFLRQIDSLYIRCDQGDIKCDHLITLQNLLEIKIQSIGNTSLNINAPAIKLLSQCQGNVTLEGKCQLLEVKNQSEGSFTSREMATDILLFKNMSVGDVKLFAEKQISISHYGEGQVNYWGNAVLKEVKQYGTGQIKHLENIN